MNLKLSYSYSFVSVLTEKNDECVQINLHCSKKHNNKLEIVYTVIIAACYLVQTSAVKKERARISPPIPLFTDFVY